LRDRVNISLEEERLARSAAGGSVDGTIGTRIF
jgi:hypothetical protein